MTRALIVIEDALETDDSRASSVDRLQRPRREDQAAAARTSEPPFGSGTYLRTCVGEDCGFRFYTDDPHAVLCPPCDGEDADRLGQGWDWHAYPARRFRRAD